MQLLQTCGTGSCDAEDWARSLPTLAQVLYNQKELPLTELCGTPACELKLFK